jgi:hypothetical protein
MDHNADSLEKACEIFGAGIAKRRVVYSHKFYFPCSDLFLEYCLN